MKDTNKILAWGAVGLGAGFALSYMLREKEEYSVKNKVVVITGGSRGLGLNLARYLLAEGAKVAICARSEKELESAAMELNTIDEVLAIQCDVTDKWQVDAMMDEIRDKIGSVDILINCAGIIQVGPFENMTVDDFDDAMKIHFWGPLYTTMSVLEDMKAKGGGGRIVNISSIGGKVTVPHLLPYISSKFALTGFSQGLRTELKKYNILVSTITPGLMRTGSVHNITLKGQHEKEYAGFSIMSAMPLITVSAGFAARRIVKALKRGEASVTISFPAKLLAAFFQRFPGFSTDIFALIDQILPGATSSNRSQRSEESYSRLSPSILTVMADHAAIDNNQI